MNLLQIYITKTYFSILSLMFNLISSKILKFENFRKNSVNVGKSTYTILYYTVLNSPVVFDAWEYNNS